MRESSDTRTRSRWRGRRRVWGLLASGALVLQAGCPIDLAELLSRELTQVVTDTIFFVVDSALVRVL